MQIERRFTLAKVFFSERTLRLVFAWGMMVVSFGASMFGAYRASQPMGDQDLLGFLVPVGFLAAFGFMMIAAAIQSEE